MLVFPYSIALTLARPTCISYGAILLGAVVYTLQHTRPITSAPWYRPESRIALAMIGAALLHSDCLPLYERARRA